MPPSEVEAQLALARRILGAEVPGLESLVRVPAGVDAATRIAVYTGGYPARLRESLRESFPALHHILGATAFAALAERYRPHVPAHATNLNAVGSELPRFLAGDASNRELPFAADLARLEWLVSVAFHARLAGPFDANAYADRSPDDWAAASVEFQPGVALVRSAWPLTALRECRHVARDEVDVELVGRPENVLVHRSGLEVATRTLDDAEADALDPLLAGEPLGRVIERLAAAGTEASEVSAHFARWAGAGLVAACRFR